MGKLSNNNKICKQEHAKKINNNVKVYISMTQNSAQIDSVFIQGSPFVFGHFFSLSEALQGSKLILQIQGIQTLSVYYTS